MTRIFFNDVATRDGFRIEPAFVPADVKVALIDEPSLRGDARIAVSSFTAPKAIPMLREAAQVMGHIRRVPGVEYTVLVPNQRGAERALKSEADELNLVMCPSQTRNLANPQATLQGGITRFDGSLGGPGGCPHAPGASGNISSEDAIHGLDAMGFETGIHRARRLAEARRMPEIVGHEVPGQVAKAGRITDLHPAPIQ